MKYPPHPCEVCGATRWRQLGKRSYVAGQAHTDSYLQNRFRVLFEQWFPGAERVELHSLACEGCGFVMYSPRPEASDLDNKYRFLARLGESYSQGAGELSTGRKRAIELHRYLQRFGDGFPRVLDFGGGDGRLMQSLIEAGSQCFLVDYNRESIAGIVRLGDTLADLDTQRFDLVVASHVIEHVAEPLGVIKALAGHLEEGGHLFVEVPMEIWRRVPLDQEPVTHINFFTPNSLWNLLVLAGLRPLSSVLSHSLQPDGRQMHTVRAIASRASGAATALKPADFSEYLKPGLAARLSYRMANPGASLRSLKRRLGWK